MKLQLVRYITYLFLVSFCCAIPGASHASQQPRSLSDQDGQAIVQLLFEREFKEEVPTDEVLLSPRLKSSWIPNLQQIKFRQLSYEEEKSGTEYYEISFDVRNDYVDVKVAKGNYCVKSGPGFRFSKVKGIWVAKKINLFESLTPGSSCPECKINSTKTYRVNRNSPKPQPAKQSLIVRANVTEVACVRDGVDLVRCKAKLNLEFSNTGSSPVIFLDPDEDSLWHGGNQLALSKSESENGDYVLDDLHWQAVSLSTEYRKLAATLDKRTPPEGFTRIMAPGELWDFSSSIQIVLRSENSCDTRLGVAIGWREIEKLASPLWMRVSYELWPFNVENFKPRLGSILQKRWARFGTLYLNDRGGNYSFGRITSEPFELDLTKVKLN